MDTYFAPPQRAEDSELSFEIEAVSKNPVVSGLLRSIGGLLAILDRHRQIIALNDSFLKLLGIDDPKEALGLRPGEALQCVHANREAAGCGTTAYCSTCGAAIAVVSSLGQDIPCERLCPLSATRGGDPVNLVFLVRSQPLTIDSRKFILLFLQDITLQEQRAALERTFYHDINNMLTMLLQASELLVHTQPSKPAAAIHLAAQRLVKEVGIQHSLSDGSINSYQPLWDVVPLEVIFSELTAFFDTHPAAGEKHIRFPDVCPDLLVKTDVSLLLRVLCNMIINALEATEQNGTIRVWAESDPGSIRFCVWNPRAIPPDISRRIFQRGFSTKAQAGRGTGTYSMKLFGEKILGGNVRFSSSETGGTVFILSLPLG